MPISLEKNAVQHVLPALEIVVRNGREKLCAYRKRTPEDLLADTLPYALASKEVGPMAAWLQYFVRTEP
jgi:hypothetical protein